MCLISWFAANLVTLWPVLFFLFKKYFALWWRNSEILGTKKECNFEKICFKIGKKNTKLLKPPNWKKHSWLWWAIFQPRLTWKLEHVQSRSGFSGGKQSEGDLQFMGFTCFLFGYDVCLKGLLSSKCRSRGAINSVEALNIMSKHGWDWERDVLSSWGASHKHLTNWGVWIRLNPNICHRNCYFIIGIALMKLIFWLALLLISQSF